MNLRPVALIFAPGCALLGAGIAGWRGAEWGLVALAAVALAGTAIHAWVSWLARDEQVHQRADFMSPPLPGAAPAPAGMPIRHHASLFKRPAR